MSSAVARKSLPETEQGLTVATAVSLLADTGAAMREIAAALDPGLDTPPDFVTLHHGSARLVSELWPHAMETFGKYAIHGASSCLGVMTAQGGVHGRGNAIGAFAIWDPAGAYVFSPR